METYRSRAREPLEIATYLDCSSCGLASLEHIGACPKLEALVVSYNSLSGTGRIHACTNLSYIDLSGNQLAYVDGLERFLALGTLKLASNKLQFAELVKLRNVHIAHLIVVDNPLAADPNYRFHVIDSMPNIWMLDGKLVSATERTQVRKFFDMELSITGGARRRAQTGRGSRARACVHGSRAAEMLRQSPLSVPHFLDLDKRRLSYVAYLVEESILNARWYNSPETQPHVKRPIGTTILEQILEWGVSQRTMLALLLAISIEHSLPSALLADALEISHIRKVGVVEAFKLFLLTSLQRIEILSVIVSSLMLTAGSEVTPLLAELDNRVVQLVNVAANPDFKCASANNVISIESLRLLCLVPSFVSSVTGKYSEGLIQLIEIATGDSDCYSTLIAVMAAVDSEMEPDAHSWEVYRRVTAFLLAKMQPATPMHKSLPNRKPSLLNPLPSAPPLKVLSRSQSAVHVGKLRQPLIGEPVRGLKSGPGIIMGILANGDIVIRYGPKEEDIEYCSGTKLRWIQDSWEIPPGTKSSHSRPQVVLPHTVDGDSPSFVIASSSFVEKMNLVSSRGLDRAWTPLVGSHKQASKEFSARSGLPVEEFPFRMKHRPSQLESIHSAPRHFAPSQRSEIADPAKFHHARDSKPKQHEDKVASPQSAMLHRPALSDDPIFGENPDYPRRLSALDIHVRPPSAGITKVILSRPSTPLVRPNSRGSTTIDGERPESAFSLDDNDDVGGVISVSISRHHKSERVLQELSDDDSAPSLTPSPPPRQNVKFSVEGPSSDSDDEDKGETTQIFRITTPRLETRQPLPLSEPLPVAKPSLSLTSTAIRTITPRVDLDFNPESSGDNSITKRSFLSNFTSPSATSAFYRRRSTSPYHAPPESLPASDTFAMRTSRKFDRITSFLEGARGASSRTRKVSALEPRPAKSAPQRLTTLKFGVTGSTIRPT